MRGRGGLLLAPSLVLLVLAFAIPVGMLVPTSFRPYVPLVGITSGFTVRYYTKLVTDSYYLEIIGRTLGLGLTVTALTLRHRLPGGLLPRAHALAVAGVAHHPRRVPAAAEPRRAHVRVDRPAGPERAGEPGDDRARPGARAGRAPVQLRRAPHRAHAHLPAVHGAGARRRHPERPARDVEDAARVLGASWASAFVRVTLPLFCPASCGVDPRLRPDHQRARDAAAARGPTYR